MPTAVGIEGRIYIVKNTAGTGINAFVAADGSETIDGSTDDYEIFTGGATTFQSDGSNWIAIAEL